MSVATAAPVAELPGLPVFGSLLDVRRDMLGLFERAAALGDVVRIRFLGRVGYLLAHPDEIKQVLVDEHALFGKNTRGYRMLRIPLGQGLVTSQGEFWRRQRRIAQPAFHHKRVERFCRIMTDDAERMLARWARLEDGARIDVNEEMMRVTLAIVGRALMTVDLSDETDRIGAAVGEALRETVHRILHPLSPPRFVPTPHNRRLDRALAGMHRLVGQIIDERRQRPGAHGDLLDMLIEARDEETGEGMTDVQLRDEVMTMVSAGHETTANALSWTFHLLAEAPEAEARLHEELDGVLGGRIPTLEDLPRLPYTEAVVKESLRLRPPVWMLARSVERPLTIRGQRLRPGNMVFLSPWITHRDPRFWRAPLAFRPERFASEAEMAALPRHAYFPFAGGPRVCIGNAFAMMEARLLLAAIAGRYRLRAEPGVRVVPEPTITLRPRGGLWMRLEARDHTALAGRAPSI